MTHVFGDIHGCLRSFENLLLLLDLQAEDTVITLGDYVDRGADSKGVIDRLIALRSEVNLIALRGNHEIMMQQALLGPPASGFWMLNGGLETMESYNLRSLKGVPEEHWEFFRSLQNHYLCEPYLFTHATPRPDERLEDFDDESYFWSRFRNLRKRDDGRFLVCGHTPTDDRRPALDSNHLCLDTGACHHGYLTALTLETGEYIQSNDQGDLRDGQLKLPPFTKAD